MTPTILELEAKLTAVNSLAEEYNLFAQDKVLVLER